jgi:maltose alpha-D-glucosyltransferase/alpha-amylase
VKRPGSASDPLWYKDAIIYELHVRAFHDANQDGIGDFQGLIQKLDYLQDLGVTCLWLLPFFPSPLRDDGYDIADYTNVHPSYGTLDDFREFLDAAHERGMQVLIELVVNHTSDQHPWFQAARRAPPGSPEREFYVWSDTDLRYAGARIIFTDTEKSNWTWDPEAKAYYWHRFFSHQPDLNFDNPAVVEEVLKVMRFWLDLGVDALRLDAIPYLIERDGTNCENLPETHAILKQIRRALDDQYANRVLLAEANQVPGDVRAYFGDEDECHMAFHFPLMPRLFMSLRLEDRLPVTEVMARTPPIADSCQWGLFLRNHDELTLEMVTDEERDYMYLAFSVDPRMRVNVGIRRRLAPLLENNRSRIELLNSILFSFPGTPILYYGDEIGMGDNIYLGDRHGVRTPMQWTADRNAGFSRANPARLYSPVIMDAIYGYEARNVEAQQSESSSLLNWTKHMIALRKLFQVFGRGTIEFLEPANRKILAYLRTFGSEQVLCVANLSRFAQPVELDLSALAGMTPVEMRGYVEFPRIGRQPYPLTLAPYGFLWFELHREAELIAAAEREALAPALQLSAGAGWEDLFQDQTLPHLERESLPAFLPAQRWFEADPPGIRACRLVDAIPLADGAGVALVSVEFSEGPSRDYVVPLALAFGADAERIREANPAAVVAPVQRGEADSGVLYDGLLNDGFCQAVLELVRAGRQRSSARGVLAGVPGKLLREAEPPPTGTATTLIGGGQRNSSIAYGDRLFAKLYRRVEPGIHPEAEITRDLTERRAFTCSPPFAGSLEYRVPGTPPATLMLMQQFVPNQGDGWTWMQEELVRYFERASTLPPDGLPTELPNAWKGPDHNGLTPALDELLGVSDDAAVALGRCTADLHQALAQPVGDPDVDPEAFTAEDLDLLRETLRVQSAATFDLLKITMGRLPDELVELASQVLSYRTRLSREMTSRMETLPDAIKIRIHGEYHLGQVLRTGQGFVIIDFEGDSAQPIERRRAKYSGLKDVASMMRSFAGAARMAHHTFVARRAVDPERLEPWSRVWQQSVTAVFLHSYRRTVGSANLLPGTPEGVWQLLWAHLLERCLSELRDELTNHPERAGVSLRGMVELLEDQAVPVGK